MLALIIILVLLILFLILPVGADAAYDGAVFTLKAKAGPIKRQLLPKKEKPPDAEGEEEQKPKKEKKQKEKKKKEKEQKEKEQEDKPKPKLTLDDIFELAGIALKALGRFRRSLSVDTFMLHLAAAAQDPYDAVLLFGRVNAGLSALSPLLHRALKIREEDIKTCVDTQPGDMFLEARVVVTIQIWEILYIAFSAGFAALRWLGKKKKETRKLGKPGQTGVSSKQKG